MFDYKEDLFRRLVANVCPSIFGLELVKAGLLLAMFGGTVESEKEKLHGFTIRPDISVLIVGDPGMGKSQLLKHVSDITPRGKDS